MRKSKDVSRGDWQGFVRQVKQITGKPTGSLADTAGVDGGTWWRWENGLQKPNKIATLQKFAVGFQLPVEQVMRAAGMMPDPTTGLGPIDLRLHSLGLRADDQVVEHILSHPKISAEMREPLLEAYAERLRLRAAEDILWMDYMAQRCWATPANATARKTRRKAA